MSNLKQEGNWLTIWKLQVPAKVKSFVWRTYRDAIPTRMNLQTRGVHCTNICGVCESSLETQCHILLSRNIWLQAGFSHVIDPLLNQVDSFFELFSLVCDVLEPSRRALFAMILWSIWKSRNQKIWNNDNM